MSVSDWLLLHTLRHCPINAPVSALPHTPSGVPAIPLPAGSSMWQLPIQRLDNGSLAPAGLIQELAALALPLPAQVGPVHEGAQKGQI